MSPFFTFIIATQSFSPIFHLHVLLQSSPSLQHLMRTTTAPFFSLSLSQLLHNYFRQFSFCTSPWPSQQHLVRTTSVPLFHFHFHNCYTIIFANFPFACFAWVFTKSTAPGENDHCSSQGRAAPCHQPGIKDNLIEFRIQHDKNKDFSPQSFSAHLCTRENKIIAHSWVFREPQSSIFPRSILTV